MVSLYRGLYRFKPATTNQYGNIFTLSHRERVAGRSIRDEPSSMAGGERETSLNPSIDHGRMAGLNSRNLLQQEKVVRAIDFLSVTMRHSVSVSCSESYKMIVFQNNQFIYGRFTVRGGIGVMGIMISCMLFTVFLFMPGCGREDDEITGPDSNTPTPAATPTKAPPTPTPGGAWGYVSGHAEVKVTELPPQPDVEKEVIFCLGNPDNENWVNVRYRSDRKFQLKGGLDPETECNDEVHIFNAQCADNGLWIVDWYEGGQVTIKSPCGQETIHIPGGQFAFRNVYQGSCGGYIPWSSSAKVEVIKISGKVGYASGCSL